MSKRDLLRQLDPFTRSYIECALWASVDPISGEPLDERYEIDDLTEETLEEMIADCADFQQAHWKDIQHDLERAGHLFWLSRNRHGAGFWDGHYDDAVGRRLHDAAIIYGSVDLLPEVHFEHDDWGDDTTVCPGPVAGCRHCRPEQPDDDLMLGPDDLDLSE